MVVVLALAVHPRVKPHSSSGEICAVQGTPLINSHHPDSNKLPGFWIRIENADTNIEIKKLYKYHYHIDQR